MIPVKNEFSGVFPWATLILIFISSLVFFIAGDNPSSFALVPLEFFHSLLHPTSNEPFTALKLLFTSFFMHANLFHLLSNMWFLWIFGGAVENRNGFLAFVVVYGSCGIISMIVQALSSPFSTIPIVGASGAIAAIMGMHLIFFPLKGIMVFFPPVFIFKIPAFAYLLPWFWIQYINLGKENANGGIAWWAHAGGFSAGVICALYLLKKRSPSKRTG